MREWEQFLSALEQELGPSIVDQWVRPLRVVRFDAANLYLEAKEPMQISWFDEHIRPRLKKEGFFNENNRPIKVHLGTALKKTAFSALAEPTFAFTPRFIDPAYTFENFSTCNGNLMAFKLFSELAEAGSSAFNPIYLYGPPGSGKTHLLMATAAKLASSKKVFYTTADAFTDHVVQAIRNSGMQQLRTTYRAIDILIIDCVEKFAGRAATQEEFFHTFNTLHTLGKQIILCSQLPPSQLQDIESRLISRFEWGIAVGVEKENSTLVLQQKAVEWNLTLGEDLLEFLTTKFPRDPVMALQALALRTETKEPITPLAATHILKDLLAAESSKTRTPEGIAKRLAAHYGIKKEDLMGKAQSREIALPRQVAMYVCRETLKMAYQAIGKIFGRDHSTVMASVKQIQKEVEAKNQTIIEATQVASKIDD